MGFSGPWKSGNALESRTCLSAEFVFYDLYPECGINVRYRSSRMVDPTMYPHCNVSEMFIRCGENGARMKGGVECNLFRELSALENGKTL